MLNVSTNGLTARAWKKPFKTQSMKKPCLSENTSETELPMKTRNSNLITFFFGEIMTKPIFCYKKAYGKHA
jgi:hypothetical protein